MQQKNHLDIIWQTEAGRQTEFERQWIDQVLLSKVPHSNLFDEANRMAKSEEPLIIYSSDRKRLDSNLQGYLEQFGSVSVLHLSNEHLNHDWRYYQKFNRVLRCYFDPAIKSGNCFTVPLGFKTGFMTESPQMKPANERSRLWTFAGQLKSHRAEMVRVLKTLSPNLIHLTEAWDGKDGLTVEQMSAVYHESVFVPCPFGEIHPDSFRVMEALESGCIPVVTLFYGIDYFKYVYGNHPFVVASDWKDALNKMKALASDPKRLEEKGREVSTWYAGFKERLSQDIHELLMTQNIDNLRLRSEQFAYQRQGQNRLKSRLIFWLHFRSPAVVRRRFQKF